MTKKTSNSIEVEGGSVEEAIKNAQEILHVSKDELEIKIITEGTKGLFGMEGVKPAKIRASIKVKK